MRLDAASEDSAGSGGEADPLKVLLAKRHDRLEPVASVTIGTIVAWDVERAGPWIAFLAHGREMSECARTLVGLSPSDIGQQTVLAFEDGDVARPIVMGILSRVTSPATDTQKTIDIQADGERVVVTASRRLVLRCGAASITLTEAGKILISGRYVLTQSSGVNKLSGGSIQLN
ncbi:MAG: DUF6484 domain-containing protein [Acidobacteriota bacterium]